MCGIQKVSLYSKKIIKINSKAVRMTHTVF
nr:MAG TPA: hypothetical protein [Caudoviricetes sp.]